MRNAVLASFLLLRHDVAFDMKLFPSKLEAGPPVPPGEPRGLNKERP